MPDSVSVTVQHLPETVSFHLRNLSVLGILTIPQVHSLPFSALKRLTCVDHTFRPHQVLPVGASAEGWWEGERMGEQRCAACTGCHTHPQVAGLPAGLSTLPLYVQAPCATSCPPPRGSRQGYRTSLFLSPNTTLPPKEPHLCEDLFD